MSEDEQTTLFERHPWLVRIRALIKSTADTDASILIRGESRRLCEIVARAIHAASTSRHPDRFLRVNCRELSSRMDALEVTLFGISSPVGRPGKGGLLQVWESTLYLEELDAMPLALQAKLLRVMTNHQLPRGEGRTPWPVDVRVVATTNEDLSDMVGRGEFLEEFHRLLKVTEIPVPPLTKEERDLEKAEEEEQARLERAWRERFDAHNDACRALARAAPADGLTCPHCGHRSRDDIEFVDHTGADLKSFFVCRACARSFGHEL